MTTEATYYLKPDGEVHKKFNRVTTWTEDASWLASAVDNQAISVVIQDGYKSYIKYFVPEGTDINQHNIANLPINSEIVKESELPDLFRMSVLCGVV